jgi:hypothetical protein
MIERAEEYRYYSSSAGDLRPLSVHILAMRIVQFMKVHRQEMNNRIVLAGGKAR